LRLPVFADQEDSGIGPAEVLPFQLRRKRTVERPRIVALESAPLVDESEDVALIHRLLCFPQALEGIRDLLSIDQDDALLPAQRCKSREWRL
jgi:hypothetical protein